ncbi:MAG TPA: hybrid sensor histidine kinase/response regulator, partial [Ignavibacteria bacterium]|nr:hybrid sensor histidine kinase/response regulator [Ignavibacteria bacterium]
RKELKSIKEVNASKDKFISILSHDLRAPFTSILGFSEILMNEPNLSKAERHEYLSYINDSAQHQLQLINYLLDWSRLQTGRIKIEPKRLNAQSIIFNCVSSLTGNAIRKNIDIKVNVDESIYVQSDERLLTQVITNLLSNAIKFSRDESSIIIYCNLFNDEFDEFVIKDHGIGISEKNKTRLFKIENMFSTEGTKGEKGTGLGLSLVKEIIEKHGGEIWFYSEPEKGSEFHFTIPRSPNSILLVEDVKGDRLYYEKLIKDNFKNFQVISVSNGFEAINTVFQKLPSLIITDHEMPLMNGSQLVENIRKEDSTLQIPIIVIATNISDKLKMTYRNLGVHQILKKPVDAKLFIEMVNLTLSEENFIKHI